MKKEDFLKDFTYEMLVDLDPRDLDDEQKLDLANAINNLGEAILRDDNELKDQSECTIALIAETQAQKVSAKARDVAKTVALSLIKLVVAL